MISADTIRLLIEAGVSGEALLRVVESVAKDNTITVTRYGNTGNAEVTRVTYNAEKQARYRARKKVTQVTRVTVTPVTPPPPSPETRPPTPPKTQPLFSTQENPPIGGQKKPIKRAIPIEAWTPPSELLAFAKSQGFGEALYARTLDQMRDWARGKGEVKKDWTAAARNWLRRAAEEKGLIPLEPLETAGTVEVFRTDARWDFLAARYERENGRNLRHAQKWPFPQGWLEGNGSLAERQTG